jgi:hypothetical protein
MEKVDEEERDRERVKNWNGGHISVKLSGAKLQ